MESTVAAVSALFCTITTISVFKWSTFITIAKNNTTGVRFASQSKPIFGGFIFLAGCISGILTNYFFVSDLTYFAYLIPIVIAFSAGLADDLYNTPPGFKLLTQVITGFAIYYSGIMPLYFNNTALDLLICILWTVTIMNSLNMLDNMDSITSSVSLIIILSAIVSGSLFGNNFHSISFAISLSVALLVFLFTNWHPAKMYMGDNGSQLLGAGVAIITLQSFAPQSFIQDETALYSLIGLIIALIIPLTDTATVSLNRIMDGKSPFVGDKNHTTHNLFYLGFQIRTIALIFIFLTFTTNIIAYLLLNGNISFSNNTAYILIFVLLISISLYITTKVSKRK